MRIDLAKALEKEIARAAGKGDFKLATKLLRDAQEKGHRPPVGAFCGVIHSFAKGGNVSECERWLKKMHTIRINSDVNCYRAALVGCSKSKFPDTQAAQRIFDLMNERQVKLDNNCFSSLITVFSKANDIKSAKHFLDSMEGQNLLLDQYAFAPVLGAYVRAGQINNAKKLLYRMVKTCGLTPDIVSVNITMDKMDKSSSELFIKFFEDMGISGTVFTYNMILNSIGKDDSLNIGARYRLGSQWFQKLLDAQVKPDIITFNSMLTICSREGSPTLARDWLEKMRAYNLKPNIYSWTSLCHSNSVIGDSDGVRNCLREMKEAEIFPSTVHYNCLINSYAKNSDGPGAARAFDELAKANQIPDASSFNTVIHSFADVCDTVNASYWFDKMCRSSKLQPTDFTWSSLLHMHSQQNDIEAIEAILAKMEKEFFYKPQTIHFSIVLDPLARRGDSNSALSYWNKIQNPNEIAFNCVLHSFGENGDYHGAMKFFQQYSGLVKINVASFNTVCGAFGKGSNIPGARRWLQFMKQQNYSPNLITFKSFFSMLPPPANLDALCHL
eukprot:gene51-3_t